MELFDVIPENFFSILSSKNKKLYLACAQQAFNVYETGSILGIERKIIIDELCLFLERNEHLYCNDEDEFKGVLEEPQTIRDTANLVIRRLEECGWIYIDVTNDYIELLNFTDCAITILEAIMTICPVRRYDYFQTDDDQEDPLLFEALNPNEYKGHIYTIYSLLNGDTKDYALILGQVLKNTKMLVRSLRKMDSRVKEYINSVVETTEIKDLMNKLVTFNQEIYEPSYSKLKTSDNINKYRLDIVNKLEGISQSSEAMDSIVLDYVCRFRNKEYALERANRDIDEIIDVFNSLDEFISGIDFKNKTYINSTIGKIKFLLTEEDNIVGKLNTLLKYFKHQHKLGKQDKALNDLRKTVSLYSSKGYSNSSLYQTRGKYSRGDYQSLDFSRFDITGLDESLLKGYSAKYEASYLVDYIERRLDSNNQLRASQILDYNAKLDDVLLCIYVLIFASENGFIIEKLDEKIDTRKFSMSDFLVTKIK